MNGFVRTLSHIPITELTTETATNHLESISHSSALQIKTTHLPQSDPELKSPQLFWVPASKHPEISPQEFDNYIKRFKLKKSLSKSSLKEQNEITKLKRTARIKTKRRTLLENNENLESDKKIERSPKMSQKTPLRTSSKNVHLMTLKDPLIFQSEMIDHEKTNYKSIQIQQQIEKEKNSRQRPQSLDLSELSRLKTTKKKDKKPRPKSFSLFYPEPLPIFEEVGHEKENQTTVSSTSSSSSLDTSLSHASRLFVFFTPKNGSQLEKEKYPIPQHLLLSQYQENPLTIQNLLHSSQMKLSNLSLDLRQQVLISNLIFQLMRLEERDEKTIELLKKQQGKRRERVQGMKMKKLKPKKKVNETPLSQQKQKKPLLWHSKETSVDFSAKKKLLHASDDTDFIFERKSKREDDDDEVVSDNDESVNLSMEPESEDEDDEMPLGLLLNLQK